MGTLHYGEQQQFEFDDAVLTHLRTVIVTKFVQHESFIFTWSDESVQRSIWLHPSQHVGFTFSDTDVVRIDREWIAELMASANSAVGLRLGIPPTRITDAARSTANDPR